MMSLEKLQETISEQGSTQLTVDQKIFLNQLGDSKKDKPVLGFPGYKNQEILQGLFDTMQLDVPDKYLKDFKLFHINGINCPCIFYKGEASIADFLTEQGKNDFGETLAKSAAFMEHNEKTDRRYIFISEGDLDLKDEEDLEELHKRLHHEAKHFFNSFKLEKRPKNQPDFIFRYLIDEVDAYFFSHGEFPRIYKFIYEYKNDDGTVEIPVLKTDAEKDDFFNTHFALYKAYKTGEEELKAALEICFQAGSLKQAAEDLSQTQFAVNGERDVELLIEFVNNLMPNTIIPPTPINEKSLDIAIDTIIRASEPVKVNQPGDLGNIFVTIKYLCMFERMSHSQDKDSPDYKRVMVKQKRKFLEIIENFENIPQVGKDHLRAFFELDITFKNIDINEA
jgi:inorganic pyrophosphatase